WFRGWTTEGRPPIRGIFHAAGVQQPRSLAELDDAGIREGLRAKVGGMQALARVIDIETLDILVAFSSAATLLPSPLLGVYAAANGFLDGFAARARQRGQRALSIAWGLLGVGGMARARAAEGRRMEFLDDMSPGRAFAAMDRLIAQGCGHAAVLAIDWPRWLESHPDTASDPYFEALVQISPSDRPAVARTAREDFAKLAPEVRSEAIRGYIRATLGRILRVPDDGLDALDLRTPLTRFGVDSLTALELRNRVEADTGAAPPVVEMLRGSSLAWLAEFIEAHLAAAEGESEPETTEWEHITI
ncbi:MAG: beta-ketoacyl reductase, partial [Nannocystaceae bacterium]